MDATNQPIERSTRSTLSCSDGLRRENPSCYEPTEEEPGIEVTQEPIAHRRRTVRIAVFVVLAAAAFAAFVLNEPIWRRVELGELPKWAPYIAPGVFTLFVVVFTVDRWLQVRRGKYPTGRALFQIGLSVVFLAFLWPQTPVKTPTVASKDATPVAVDLGELLAHEDGRVRALACEAAAHRADGRHKRRVAALAKNDPDATTRSACASALRELP